MSNVKKDIYVIKNDINNKVYVGQAINTKQRFQNHCNPSSSKYNDLVSRAIQKYGKSHFWYEILESQIENYDEREKYWISYYNCIRPNGYNISEGGNYPPLQKGTQHPESRLTDKQLNELIYDLQNTQLSYSQLSDKYDLNKTSIYEINNGKTYFNSEISYPIRTNKNLMGVLPDTQVLEIIELLKTTYLSYEEIGRQYGVEARTISRINRGIYHKQANETYPIRIGKLGNNTPKLSYKQVTEIIDLLVNSTLSLRQIAKRFGVEYKDILGIKNGTTKLYRRKDLKYPLRSNN